MWTRLPDWIHRVSNGWLALSALIIFLLFVTMVLPGQTSTADSVAGNAGTPDLSFYYSADDLYRMAEAYGEDGRRAYVSARATFDVIWPLVYTFFLLTGISWLSRKAFAATSMWQRANLAPLLATLFDFLENGSTSLVMIRYPGQTAVIADLSGVFTAVKWIFVGVSLVLLLAALGVSVWRWLSNRPVISS